MLCYKLMLYTASKGMLHVEQPPPFDLARADTLSVSELGVDSTDELSEDKKTVSKESKGFFTCCIFWPVFEPV